jgi:hypothetical protein
MKYIGISISAYLIIIHFLRLVKLHFNPKILQSNYFNPILSKGYITFYYIITMFFLLIVILYKLGMIEL